MRNLWLLIIFLLCTSQAFASIKRERVNPYTWYAATYNDVTGEQELRMYVINDVSGTYTISITCVIPDKTVTITLTDLVSPPVLSQKAYPVTMRFDNKKPIVLKWYTWPDQVTITRAGDVELMNLMRTHSKLRIGKEKSKITFKLRGAGRTIGRVVQGCR